MRVTFVGGMLDKSTREVSGETFMALQQQYRSLLEHQPPVTPPTLPYPVRGTRIEVYDLHFNADHEPFYQFSHVDE